MLKYGLDNLIMLSGMNCFVLLFENSNSDTNSDLQTEHKFYSFFLRYKKNE